jgi:hypothetical protein
LVSPVNEPSLKVPFTETLAEWCPTTRPLLHSSVKVPGIRAPHHIPGSPRMETGPHGERCPYPEGGWSSDDGGSISWPKPRYPPIRFRGPITQKTIIWNPDFPWNLSQLYLLQTKQIHVLCNECTLVFYILF